MCSRGREDATVVDRALKDESNSQSPAVGVEVVLSNLLPRLSAAAIKIVKWCESSTEAAEKLKLAQADVALQSAQMDTQVSKTTAYKNSWWVRMSNYCNGQ